MPRIDDYSFRHDGVIYTFTLEAQEAVFESKLAGRKIFKDVEVLNGMVPSMYGVPKQGNSDVVTEDLIERKGFQEHYDKWKAGVAASEHGLPVDQYEDFTPAQAKTLQTAKINTVEAFIESDETLLSKLLGPSWRTLRDQARDRIGYTVDPGAKKALEENVKLKDRLDSQAGEMDALRQQIAALTAAKAQEPEAAPRPRSRAPSTQQPADAA